MSALEKIFNKREDNHLLPFFWLAGENKQRIKQYVEIAHKMGLGAITLESRTHPAFLEDEWFDYLKFIISECKKYDMKVWILDAAHFPSGYANGAIEKTNDKSLRKVHLFCDMISVKGEDKYFKINYYAKMLSRTNKLAKMDFEGHRFLKLIAAKRISADNFETDGNFIDLTAYINGPYCVI